MENGHKGLRGPLDIQPYEAQNNYQQVGVTLKVLKSLTQTNKTNKKKEKGGGELHELHDSLMFRSFYNI